VPADLAKLPHITTQIPTTISKFIGINSEWNITSLADTAFHESYHPLYEINSFLNKLSDAHPNITRLVNLGLSAEGRSMTGIAISTGPYTNQGGGGVGRGNIGGKRNKKHEIRQGLKLGFVIVGAQHAREVRVSS
jgi:extracellular matrix protein 14